MVELAAINSRRVGHALSSSHFGDGNHPRERRLPRCVHHLTHEITACGLDEALTTRADRLDEAGSEVASQTWQQTRATGFDPEGR